MDREILSDEDIALEKVQKEKIRKNEMKLKIDKLVSEFESRTCEGRIFGKHHYMRRIDRLDRLADIRDPRNGQYKIMCEFCDIFGISVNEKKFEVINLGNGIGEQK